MSSLQGKNIKSTYKGLLKTIDNDELLGQKEITDGNGNTTGVSLNNQGDVIATGKVSFDSLEGNITINKFVDEADGISANDNDSSIPTSAAVKNYVDNSVPDTNLNITDGVNNGSVDLNSQSFTFTGDVGVSATVSGQTLTFDSSALQSQIDSNDSDITALQGADVTLQSNIDAEETARIAADNALQNNITTEESARSAADTALQDQITANDGDISALDARLTTAEGDISSNDTDISNLDSRLTTAEGNITSNDSDISALQSSKQDISEKNQANGYAPLDSGAKVPIANLPDSVVGQVEYQGTWDASTDTPTLPSASTVKGHYYVVSVAGTYQTVDYSVGDWIISSGTAWEKVDNTDAVTTVFGRLGAVVANEADYSSFYPLISDLDTTNSNVSGLDTRLTTAEGNITSNDSDISGLDTRLTTAEGDITALEADVAVNNAKISFDSASSTKLAGIETGADVTDTANVVASLTAGTNISISGAGVISSTDTNTTYTAGTGLTLSGTQFRVNAAQTGVTSLGTLSSLDVSGDISAAKIKNRNDTDTYIQYGSNEIAFYTGNQKRASVVDTGVKFAGGVRALDYYEYGTWIPTLSGGGTIGQNSGTYVRVGKHVTINFRCTDMNVTANTNTFGIGGMPFKAPFSRFYGVLLSYTGRVDFSDWYMTHGNNSNIMNFDYVLGGNAITNNDYLAKVGGGLKALIGTTTFIVD